DSDVYAYVHQRIERYGRTYAAVYQPPAPHVDGSEHARQRCAGSQGGSQPSLPQQDALARVNVRRDDDQLAVQVLERPALDQPVEVLLEPPATEQRRAVQPEVRNVWEDVASARGARTLHQLVNGIAGGVEGADDRPEAGADDNVGSEAVALEAGERAEMRITACAAAAQGDTAADRFLSHETHAIPMTDQARRPPGMLAAVTQARDEESFDRLGVVVVNHAAPTEVLNDAMLRLRASAPGARVILVATGTGTPSPEAGWPEDTEIVRVPNRSYAHAVNAGFAMLDGVDLLTMMNDDVLVEPRTFADLVIALRAHPGTGLAGPIPRDASGRPQDLGVP